MNVDLFDDVLIDLSFEALVFIILFVLSFFIVLYALTLINNKLSLIESDLTEMRKDQSVMTDELEIVASSRSEKKIPNRLT